MGDIKRFLKLLRVEIDDLKDDLSLRLEMLENRYKRAEITQYVKLANEALFKREFEILEKYATIVDGIDPSFYKDISEAEKALLDLSRNYASRLLEPEAVYILIKRKIEKVKAFIQPDDKFS